MGTKYSSNASSGYNATPPADDGTVSEANKVKYSTIKTKLSDPIKTLADTINSELATHFDNGPNNYTVSQTLAATNFNQVNQVSGSGVTLSLTAATTLAAGWFTDIVSTDTTNSVTLARLAAADTINGVSSDVTILPLQALRVVVNAAATGFLASVSESFSSSGLIAPNGGIGPNYLQNIGITATVAAKALTIDVKNKALDSPTSGSPAQVSFRSATLATGAYVTRSVTTSDPIIIPSTATLGFAASQTGYLYVYLMDNSGTMERAISGSNRWDEGALQSSTALSNASDSGTVLYANFTRSNLPIRYIGRIKIQSGAVAGEWDNAPTERYVGSQWIAPIQLVPEQTASGTSIDFTGIPRDVKRITIMLNGISGNGTSILQVQIGDAGGIETTGYIANSSAGATANTLTSGFVLAISNGASALWRGKIELNLQNSGLFTWVSSGMISDTSSALVVNVSVGTKSLSQELTQLRLTTVNGTDTFDAGTISISYE